MAILRGVFVRSLRTRVSLVVGLLVLLSGAPGCQNFGLKPLDFKKLTFRSQSPEDEKGDGFDDEFETKIEVPMVGDYTTFTGLHRVVLEGVGLVVGLNGTGGDPPPSPEREALLNEMRRHNVKKAKDIIRSPDTALVVVRAYLPALVKKGERFDIEVRIPGETGATSLNGGRLMQTVLSETAIVAGRGKMRGHIVAKAKGPVLVTGDSRNPESQAGVLKRGLILGGGVSLIDRDMALYVKTDYRTYRNITRLADRIGLRFSAYDRYGVKEPLAKAQTDQRIMLKVHPRYKENYPRYLQVVQSIAFKESPVAQRVRMKRLEQQLLTPETSEKAALQLEAIGDKAISVLKTGLKHPELECRFHSAIALAYLGESDGIETLREAGLNERAFRVFAFAALSIIEDPQAHLALRSMMDVQKTDDGTEIDSAETRYGAFRALWTLDADDPFIDGKHFNDEFWFHTLKSSGDPMIHISRRKRSEVVLFGEDQEFHTPLMLRAGNHIVITSRPGSEHIVVSRFFARRGDQRKVVSRRVGDVITAAAELGATYPDIVQMLVEADRQENLGGRFEIDALPQAGRVYFRGENRTRVGRSTFTPNMFGGSGEKDPDAPDGQAEPSDEIDEEDRGFATVVDARTAQAESRKTSRWNPMSWFRRPEKE